MRSKIRAPIGTSRISADNDASASATGARSHARAGIRTIDAPAMIAAVAPKVSHRPTSAMASGVAIRMTTAVSAIACTGAVR